MEWAPTEHRLLRQEAHRAVAALALLNQDERRERASSARTGMLSRSYSLSLSRKPLSMSSFLLASQ